jgi:hypothetical protein
MRWNSPASSVVWRRRQSRSDRDEVAHDEDGAIGEWNSAANGFREERHASFGGRFVQAERASGLLPATTDAS